MAITYKMDLRELTEKPSKALAEEIAELLYDKVLEYASEAKSPVSGEKWKKSLSDSYKKLKGDVSGESIANMELYGDMLDALKTKVTKNTIEIGIWDRTEVKKLDGHGHYGEFGISKLPRRRLLPDEDQKFKREIMQEVMELVKEYED